MPDKCCERKRWDHENELRGEIYRRGQEILKLREALERIAGGSREQGRIIARDALDGWTRNV